MANNIEVILTGKDAGFTEVLNKAAATLNAKNTEMLNSLGKVGGALNDTATGARQAGEAVSASASKYSALTEASQQLAAAQVLAKTGQKDISAALKAGEIDAVTAKAAQLQLSAAVKAAAADYSTAARAIANGAGDVVGSHNRMSVSGMLMVHSVRSAADSFAAGLPPMMIFSEQLGRLGEAAALSGGGEGSLLGKMGAFMAGPWGIAVVGAVAVLGTMISHMHLFGNEVDDAVKKLKEQAHSNDIARIAQEQFDHTLEGSIEKERKLNEELERRIKNQAQLNHDKTTEVASNLTDLRTNQGTAQRAFNDAKTARDSAADMMLHPPAGMEPAAIAGLAIAYRQAEQRFAKAQTDLINANAAVLDGERNLRTARALEIQDQAKGIADAKLGERQAIEAKMATLNERFTSGGMSESLYRQKYADLQRQLDAVGKAASDAGPSLGNMVALIKQLFPGARITSTTGGQHVAGSDHYSGHAIDFVPAGGMGQYSKADVEQRLKDAGVAIRRNASGVEQFFGPGDKGHSDHFHVAWTGDPSPESAQRRAEAAARKQQEEQDKATRRAKAFADASDNLDAQILAAKKAQTTDIDDLARIALAEVNVADDKFQADVLAKEKTGDLTKAQGDELLMKEAQLVALKQERILQQQKYEHEQQDLKMWVAANDNTREVLQLQEQMAVTQAERRAIQLQLLASEKEQARREAQAVLDNPNATASDQARARGTLGNLDTVYGLKQQGVIQGTESPLEAYIRQNDPKLLQERISRLEVDELEAVRNGIDDAISNALGVKDPFLKGLIDLFVQTVLIDPIAKALQSHMGGGGGFGGFLSGIGSLFGGGAGPSAALMPSVESTFAANAAIFVDGGFVRGPGSGTSDSIHARLSNGEYVLTAEAVKRLGVGNLDMLNRGQAPRFASGGFVGKFPPLSPRNDNAWSGDAHFHFPGVSNAREARESGDQAARAFRRRMNGTVRN